MFPALSSAEHDYLNLFSNRQVEISPVRACFSCPLAPPLHLSLFRNPSNRECRFCYIRFSFRLTHHGSTRLTSHLEQIFTAGGGSPQRISPVVFTTRPLLHFNPDRCGQEETMRRPDFSALDVPPLSNKEFPRYV